MGKAAARFGRAKTKPAIDAGTEDDILDTSGGKPKKKGKGKRSAFDRFAAAGRTPGKG